MHPLLSSECASHTASTCDSLAMGDIEMQPLVEVKSKRWPRMFWFLLRILGLFYHRSVVLERKCFSCSVIQERRSCKEGQFHGVNTELDFYISAYEADSPVTYEHKKKTAQGENECAVCQSLWWNCNGNPYKYTERDIGRCFFLKVLFRTFWFSFFLLRSSTYDYLSRSFYYLNLSRNVY